MHLKLDRGISLTQDFLIHLGVGLCVFPPESLLLVSPLTNFLDVLHNQVGLMCGTLAHSFSLPTPINLKETAFAQTGILISECVSVLMTVM